MNRYCQLQDNIAWHIFYAEAKPDFHPDIVILNISAPEYDWVYETCLYDSETEQFHEPMKPELIRIVDTNQVAQEALIESKYQSLLLEIMLNGGK